MNVNTLWYPAHLKVKSTIHIKLFWKMSCSFCPAHPTTHLISPHQQSEREQCSCPHVLKSYGGLSRCTASTSLNFWWGCWLGLWMTNGHSIWPYKYNSSGAFSVIHYWLCPDFCLIALAYYKLSGKAKPWIEMTSLLCFSWPKINLFPK